jgi:hypothetical protein
MQDDEEINWRGQATPDGVAFTGRKTWRQGIPVGRTDELPP